MPEAPPPTPVPPTPAPTAAPLPFPILRALAILGGGVLVLASVVYGVLHQLGYPVHAMQNVLAAAVCGGAGLAGLLPVWLMSRTSSHGAAQGFMAGIVLRMFVAGAVVLAAQWNGYEHARVLGYWVAGWYLAVLILEVQLVGSFAFKHSVPADAGPPPAR